MLVGLPAEFGAADLAALKSLAARPSAPAAMADDFGSLQRATAEERQSAAPGSFGVIPISVVSHGIPYPAPFDALEEPPRACRRTRRYSTDRVEERILTRLTGAGFRRKIRA